VNDKTPKSIKTFQPPYNSAVHEMIRQRVESESTNGVMKTHIIPQVVIPGASAAFVSPFATISKQHAINKHTGRNVPLFRLKGGAATTVQMIVRNGSRTALAPEASQFAVDNRPEWMSIATAKSFGVGALGTVGDIVTGTPIESICTAKQTYHGKGSGPSIASWVKQDGINGALRNSYRGTLPVAGRSVVVNGVLNGTKQAAHEYLDPENKNPSLQNKIMETGAAALATTVTNSLLNPLGRVQTLMQRNENPLNFKDAVTELGNIVKKEGPKALYRGVQGRAVFTALSAGMTAGTLGAQASWQDSLENNQGSSGKKQR